MMKKISLIIPAYNEERRIGNTINIYSKYLETLRKMKELSYEILIVINNTTDNTEGIVRAFSKKNKRILYINLVKGGKGYAVIEGFKNALQRDSNLIGFVDADMSTPPEAFHDLIREMSNYDGAVASRYVKGSIVNPKPTTQRIIASRMFNVLIKSLLFLQYKDTQCGAKIFKREALEKTIPSLTMSQWAFDVDLLFNLKKQGFKIKEISTRWSDKDYSKINFVKAGPKMALGIIRLRILNSPFRELLRVYDLIFKVIKRAQ